MMTNNNIVMNFYNFLFSGANNYEEAAAHIQLQFENLNKKKEFGFIKAHRCLQELRDNLYTALLLSPPPRCSPF